MKKEIIQFFKSKTNVIAMLIFPIVLIFVMGKSLDGLMSMDKNIFSGKIIYFNIEDSSGNKNLQPFYDFSVQFQKDTEAEFVENTNPEEAIKLVNKNEAICFINVCKDDIKYFRNENGESTTTETNILALSSVYMLDDNMNELVADANLEMFNNALSEYINTDDSVETLSIPSKSLQASQLTITASVSRLVGIIVAVVLPIAILVAGIVIWTRRRKR